MPNPQHRLLLGALIVASVCAVSACSEDAGGSDAARLRAAAPPPAVPVTAATVVQKSMPLNIDGIGTVIAASTVAIHSQITGELTSVNFVEGDEVKQGQVLVTFDKRPLVAALNQAQATLDRDIAQAANARAENARYQGLQARGIATHEQVDQMGANAAALDATVEADRAAVDNAKVQLEYATIKSPLTGRTGLLMVHPGNLVRANDTAAIVTINKIQPVYVSFAIPEAELSDLKRFMAKGTLAVTAQLPNDTGSPSVGKITFVDNAVDVTTGTIKVKGTFPNDDRRLWPGLYVNVRVTLTSNPTAIVVPTAAVQTGQQGDYAFVVKADQTVELRNLQIERAVGQETVIKSGLKAGETVVTDGQLRLVPGVRVSVKPSGGKAAS